MKKFQFQDTNERFSGDMFFKVFQNADFLCHTDNVMTILTKSYQLRQALKDTSPGEKVTMENMWLTNDYPLLVIKSGPNVMVKYYEFTANRLTGLTAAYAFENRNKFPDLHATEGMLLGLKWNNTDLVISRLYLACVSGAEHFYDQFSFWPLVCALKKLQLKKITLEPVIKMAKIKNKRGIRLCEDMMSDWKLTCTLWSNFSEAKVDLKKTLHSFPRELKHLFP